MRIAAVVVTYNRLELLKKCLNSLKNQTRKPDEFVVVNNSSTDGTVEWLNDQRDLTVINQENLGGAGGFYSGIKYAYDNDHDCVWCMDDDCIADVNALESLLNNLKSNSVLNSLVLSTDNPDKLAFGLYEFNFGKYYRELKDIRNKEMIESQNFFNGSLFSREIISNVGFPSKELFIRGDEFEYYLRISKAGYNVYTIISSIIFHPPEKKIIIDIGILYYEFLFLNSFKRYYHIRNLLLIVKQYDLIGYKYFFKNFLLDIIFIIFIQRSFGILISHLKGFLKAIMIKVKFQ
ncbi:glycosyltransferase family 2 protein [Bacteroidota bacterium]